MKKSPILFVLCALFLVSFVSGGFVKESSAQSTELKGKVIKKVKNLDLAHASPRAGNRSAAMIRWSYAGSGAKGAKWDVTVFFFREFENFTCRVYRTKNGKASGKPISLPKKSLVVGFHRFKINTRSLKPILKCQESDSMPQTLAEVKEIDEMPVTPALTIGESGPADTTQQDRDRGWKLVEAVGLGREYVDQSSLLGAIQASSIKSTVMSEVYFYEPVEKLACQLYYTGSKKKKYGKKLGMLENLYGQAKGLLSFNVSGPAKDDVRPMRLVCSEDEKSLPKKLLSEIPEGLHMIDVVVKR